MSDLTNDKEEYLDPVVKAAMIPQPSDPKEEKSTETGEEQIAAPAEDEKEETPEPNQAEAKEDQEAEKGEEGNLEKPTRKERREERKRFLDSVRKEQEHKADNRQNVYQADPDYKPMEFENKDYDFKELEEDRNKYGQNQFYKGAQTAAQIERDQAEQAKFWQATEYESKLLEREPDFSFLNEADTESFDADKTAFINESYLAFVGYNPEDSTVQRTDISFENYTRTLVDQVKSWAEDMTDNVEKNAAAQRSNSGVRPGGSPRKSLGQLQPGDITNMSDADYAKNKDEINRQILAAL